MKKPSLAAKQALAERTKVRNYRASLELEGIAAPVTGKALTREQLIASYSSLARQKHG
ncbi:YhfG family protein [Jeongeupia sp. USM3]|uniref:YhfG family protein n=1 Tax=Jeongeupia sp. USM3 TaxID=1906741 RepID=UPI0011AB59BF|nr:YhfG family protein [Jeongeupia sp. USM3]